MLRMRRIDGGISRWLGCLAVIGLVGLSGCRKGTASDGEVVEPPRADDRAETLAGRYTGVDSYRASDGCSGTRSEGPGDGGTLVIEQSDDRLAFRLCAPEEGCDRPIWSGRLDKGAVFGWEQAEGSAEYVDSGPMSQRCRFSWRRTALVPDEEGLELERVLRRGTVTLEGDMSCDAQMAADLSDTLPCHRREWLRARHSDD
jgi:hypothetical protein